VISSSALLGNLPPGLRQELTKEFEKITRNYREHRWEATELDGGRFCEIVYSILNGYLDNGNFPPKSSKPRDFKSACAGLEGYPKTFPDSARITIPRVLVGLYDIRNRRGVGHVGGDVDANHMDATFALHTAQWIMAELVRIFHSTDTTTATRAVDSLVDRTTPLIWEIDGSLRILRTDLTLSDSTLLLLHSSATGMLDKDLASHLEQPRLSNYKRVLHQLHSARKIEYDNSSGKVNISPLGVSEVESRILTI
jgi:hypothetical protein